MTTLNGQVAIVTGGGSGIGRAISLALAVEGCAVAVLDQDARRASETVGKIALAGGRGMTVVADVTVSAQVDSSVGAVAEAFGRIDILVNNAGVGWLGTVETLSESNWDRVMAINVKSVFLCSRASLPHLVAAPSGRIINVASVTGLVASAGRAVYCASKGAVVMLTRAMALDCAAQKVNVNAICPGVVQTPMTEASLRDPAVMQEKLDKTPLGRLATPEEIAPAAVYLAGPGASFVTGACLVVDGGWSID